MRSSKTIVLAVILTLSLASCDFDAAEKAFDDLAVIIELEPINTVVTGIVVDQADGELVAAKLTFSGPGGGAVIDAYSDPMTSVDADGGLLTFGIRNEVVPSEDVPVEIAVTVEANGYFTQERTVRLSETGDNVVMFQLISRDLSGSVAEGTAAIENRSVSANSTGAIQQDVTIQTPMPASTVASTTVSIPAGMVALSATGVPLQGQLTTTVKTYDSSNGLLSLPDEARRTSDGTYNAIAGAVFFEMKDSAGNVAVRMQPATSGKAAGKVGGTCIGGSLFTLRSRDALVRGLVDTAPSRSVPVQLWAYDFNGVLSRSYNVAATHLEADETGGTKADFCLGGRPGSTGLITLPDDIFYSGSSLYVLVIQPAVTRTGPLNHVVTFGTGPLPSLEYSVANILFRAPGVVLTGFVNWGTSKRIRDFNTAYTEAVFTLPNPSPSFIDGRAFLDARIQFPPMQIASGFEGASTVVPPSSSSGLENFEFSTLVSCDPGKEFQLQLTNESLDGLSILYKSADSGAMWSVIPTSAIENKWVTQTGVWVTGHLGLIPNTQYLFKAVFGSDIGSTRQTTPNAGQTFSVTLNASDLGLTCKTAG